MGTSRKAFVLNVGKEASFRELRHRLLVDAGFEAVSVESLATAESSIKNQCPQALVVGAWVTKDERNELVRIVKAKNPLARIIFYYDQNINDTEQADAILNFRGDHSDLIRTLRHLLSKDGIRALKHLAALALSFGVSAPWSLLGFTNP